MSPDIQSEQGTTASNESQWEVCPPGTLAEFTATRKALEANPRIQHLRQFPHLKPSDWEAQALAALSPGPIKEASDE